MNKNLFIPILTYAGLLLAGLLAGSWLMRSSGEATERFHQTPAYFYTQDMTVSWWACPPGVGSTLLVSMPMRLRYAVDPAQVAPGVTGLAIGHKAVRLQPALVPTDFHDLLADLRVEADAAPAIRAEIERAEAIAAFIAADQLRWQGTSVREGISRSLAMLWRAATGSRTVEGGLRWPDAGTTETDAKGRFFPPFGIPVCGGHSLMTINGETYLMQGGHLLRTDSSAGAAARFAGPVPPMLAADARKKPELLQATQLQQAALDGLQTMQARRDALRAEAQQINDEMAALQAKFEALEAEHEAALASDAGDEVIQQNERARSALTDQINQSQDRLDRLAEQEIDLDPQQMLAERQARTAELYGKSVVQS
ncbi:MAG: hypothetical protein ACRESW_06830, partial [Nevskiales bacterium]